MLITDKMTWMCEICKQERIDAQISVEKHSHKKDSGIIIGCNIKYCNDNKECIEGTKYICFVEKIPKPWEGD